ncbi:MULTISPECIES: hypothetical protein [Sorangium]|uniref:Uncharacterized protein n=1 Tax=Sorangium cellulosum TaxID=56 RepID=A0A4P2QFN6_SORCE|nr:MULTISPECIES: hypothetical protein [Sorangium]AUX28645.1 uncharacterized protein SOCE836_007240 [Sorangium cellulosum]WCQ88040.1 hypothetical protein NQZ70_00711 [Sorangium sp. Soce836]
MKSFDDQPLVPLGMGDDLGPYRIHRRLKSPQGTELYQARDRADPDAPLVRLEVWVKEPHDRFMQLARSHSTVPSGSAARVTRPSALNPQSRLFEQNVVLDPEDYALLPVFALSVEISG